MDSPLWIRRMASERIKLISTVFILGHCSFCTSWGTVLVTTTYGVPERKDHQLCCWCIRSQWAAIPARLQEQCTPAASQAEESLWVSNEIKLNGAPHNNSPSVQGTIVTSTLCHYHHTGGWAHLEHRIWHILLVRSRSKVFFSQGTHWPIISWGKERGRRPVLWESSHTQPAVLREMPRQGWLIHMHT